MTTLDEYNNSQHDDLNDEKIELNSTNIPLGAVFYEIRFKISTNIFCYENNELVLPCLVIVQADRGYDIGVAVRCLPSDELQTNGKIIRKILSVITNDDKYIKYMLQSKAISEKQALIMSKTICSELKVGPSVDIMSVEFQADRKKLTVYYKKHADVSLCKLIRKLHSAFKMRIWMENLDAMQLDPDQELSQTLHDLEEKYFTLASIDPNDPHLPDNNSEDPNVPVMTLPSGDPTSNRSPNSFLTDQSPPEPKLQTTLPSGLPFLPRSAGSTPQSVASKSPFLSDVPDEYSYHPSIPPFSVRQDPAVYFDPTQAARHQSQRQTAQPQRKHQLPHRPPPPSGYSDYLPQAPPSYAGYSSVSQIRRSTQPASSRQLPPRSIPYGSDRDLTRDYSHYGPTYSNPNYYDPSLESDPYRSNIRNPSRNQAVPPRYNSVDAHSNQAYYGRYQSPRDIDAGPTIASPLLAHNYNYSLSNRQHSRSSFPSEPIQTNPQRGTAAHHFSSTQYEWNGNNTSNYGSLSTPPSERHGESYHSGRYETYQMEDTPVPFSMTRPEESRLLSRNSFEEERTDRYNFNQLNISEKTSPYYPSGLPAQDPTLYDETVNFDRFHLE